MRKESVLIFSGVLLVLIFASGCTEPIAKQSMYLLSVPRDGQLPTAKGKGDLLVKDIEVSSAFRGKGLVYRVDEHRYESDYYNEFMTFPEIILTEETAKWLDDAKLFKNVYRSRDVISPQYVLTGNVIKLYGDFYAGPPFRAIVEIRFTLQKGTSEKNEFMLNKVYVESIQFNARNAQQLVKAYNKALRLILYALEQDLAVALMQNDNLRIIQ